MEGIGGHEQTEVLKATGWSRRALEGMAGVNGMM
jgi:hypothetical protein